MWPAAAPGAVVPRHRWSGGVSRSCAPARREPGRPGGFSSPESADEDRARSGCGHVPSSRRPTPRSCMMSASRLEVAVDGFDRHRPRRARTHEGSKNGGTEKTSRSRAPGGCPRREADGASCEPRPHTAPPPLDEPRPQAAQRTRGPRATMSASGLRNRVLGPLTEPRPQAAQGRPQAAQESRASPLKEPCLTAQGAESGRSPERAWSNSAVRPDQSGT